MSQDLGSDNRKRLASRELILGAGEQPKNVMLPTQTLVAIKYFSLKSIVDILSNVMNLANEERGIEFSNQAIAFMLRENGKKDLKSFSSEDQAKLIEIAVDEWGCEKEYKELETIPSLHSRFFEAAKLHENNLEQDFAQSIMSIDTNMSKQVLESFNWMEDYQKRISELLSFPTIQIPIPQFQITNAALGLYSIPDLHQYLGLGQLNNSIAKLADQVIHTFQVLQDDFSLDLTQQMLSTYRPLMASISLPDAFAQLPKVLRLYPPIEMNNSLVLDSYIQKDETAGELVELVPTDDLSAWLAGYDPDFLNMVNGARQAVFSDNPDKIRHFASSHRELDTHILELFAPEDEVKQWTNDKNDFSNGKPTRKARLKYIARNFPDQSFVDFFVSDGLSQNKILNADEHKKGHSYSNELLLAMHKRFSVWLEFLRQIVDRAENN